MTEVYDLAFLLIQNWKKTLKSGPVPGLPQLRHRPMTGTIPIDMLVSRRHPLIFMESS